MTVDSLFCACCHFAGRLHLCRTDELIDLHDAEKLLYNGLPTVELERTQVMVARSCCTIADRILGCIDLLGD